MRDDGKIRGFEEDPKKADDREEGGGEKYYSYLLGPAILNSGEP